MRIKVILNPWADRGRAAQLKDALEVSGAKYGGLDVELTQAPGHAAILARTAAEEGYERIGVAGGDGTVHEVVNGLMAVPAGERPAIGLIPVGSGNDYAYGAGLVLSPEVAVERLFTGETRRMDLALLEDNRGQRRYACNGIGIGFDAAIAIATTRIKRLYGFAAYFAAALQTIALHYERPQYTVTFDGETVSQPSLLLGIGVGPRIGGGFLLTPDATFEDGLLDSCLVDSVGRLTMLRMMPRVMKGTHITSKIVQMRRNKLIGLASDLPLPIHLDGEIFATVDDEVHQVTVRSIAGAVAVVA